MTRPPEEPPLEIELRETWAKRASEIIQLADIHERNRKRKASLNPLPVFPVEDSTAAPSGSDGATASAGPSSPEASA